MDIFKLFYEHDLRLDDLADRPANTGNVASGTIESFMRPDPTYSKFYLTGTRLDIHSFGLSVLSSYDDIIKHMNKIFEHDNFYLGKECVNRLETALVSAKIGEAILISNKNNEVTSVDSTVLNISSDSNIGHIKPLIRTFLADDFLVLYKEQAHDGFDLHLLSKENIYGSLFYPYRTLVSDTFRFFSINSKRVRSEQKFYFETWTLDKPPHGVEEVFPETTL